MLYGLKNHRTRKRLNNFLYQSEYKMYIIENLYIVYFQKCCEHLTGHRVLAKLLNSLKLGYIICKMKMTYILRDFKKNSMK